MPVPLSTILPLGILILLMGIIRGNLNTIIVGLIATVIGALLWIPLFTKKKDDKK